MSVISSMPDSASQSLDKPHTPANGNTEPLGSEDGSSTEEADFNWDEYLEETGASAAPHTSFKHVEISLQSSFQPGMKLEVANKSNPDTYWVATIITTCGQLLLLRYFGYGDDRKADFWCDVMTAELHPVGWCTQNNKVLMPPDAIKENCTDWTEFLIHDLTGSRTAPANLLEGPLRGKNSVDLLTVDSLMELQDSQNPFQYWIVSVIENIGGRLRLRYVGLEGADICDQWLFYLDCRLRPIGWCQENNYKMDPPSEIRYLKSISEWKCALEKSLDDAAKCPLPVEAFKDHADLRSHAFIVGMKLEAVDPTEHFNICPASVTQVFNNHYFQVTIDDLRPDPGVSSMLCHADSLGILPVQWCLKNGVNLTAPKGYSGLDFDWADYQKQCGAEAAPHVCFRNTSNSRGFTKNMKLEAVNPRNPSELCVASITKVKGRLMWLHLEVLQKPVPEYIVDVESMDIFPVGWCEANGYSLTPPQKAVLQQTRKIAVVQPEKQLPSSVPLEKIPQEPYPVAQTDPVGYIGEARTVSWPRCHEGKHEVENDLSVCLREEMDFEGLPERELNHFVADAEWKGVPEGGSLEKSQSVVSMCGSANGKYCCPQLYINHRCFSGPYLNKGRIAELPQTVGPGKCVLVLKEVLGMVINAAYKPGRVLRELQLVGDPQWNFQEETLKAKYKGKSYRSTVKIVKTSDQVDDFCKSICAKLECCPNLFSPNMVTETCSENCSVHTKTKYTYYYGKRTKIIKPPIGEGNDESSPIKPGRRRKRRKSIFVQKKRRSSTVDFTPMESAEESEDEDPEAMEEESGSEETSSELREDQTDTFSAEVPPTRPRRAVTLRSSTEYDRPLPAETEKRERRTRDFSHHGEEKRISVKTEIKPEEEEGLVLESNPLEWTVTDVVRFIKATDCAPLAKIFHEQDIDGQALLLLTLPTVQECMELKLGPAIKLCHQIERVKVAFYAQFAN